MGRGEIEGLKVRVFERVLVIHRDTRIERATHKDTPKHTTRQSGRHTDRHTERHIDTHSHGMHAHTQGKRGGETDRETEEGKNLVVKAETAMTVMSGRNRFY